MSIVGCPEDLSERASQSGRVHEEARLKGVFIRKLH